MYYGDGDELGWHFDPNNGVVTVLLQSAEVGGGFEFVPNIRRDDAEGRAAVARIMDGARDGVITALLLPGTLALFQGVDSLHRVTPVKGEQPRIILTLSFDTEPGTLFSPEIRRRYSGRVS
jgi:2OG-Fe(II) oxygenase superfamily